MKKYTKEELQEVIQKHYLFLQGEDNGERANLSYTDLRFADLRYANLRYANLRYANLRYTDLRYTDLSSTDLRYADLSFADLSSTDLSSTDLSYANLSSTDLSYTDLSSADLRFVAAGENVRIKTLQLGRYLTTITKDTICVGCRAAILPLETETEHRRKSVVCPLRGEPPRRRGGIWRYASESNARIRPCMGNTFAERL